MRLTEDGKIGKGHKCQARELDLKGSREPCSKLGSGLLKVAAMERP